MKLPLITAQDLIKGDETEETPAKFAKKALAQLRAYYQQGQKAGSWNLTEAEFIAWMAAIGVTSSVLGRQTEDENEKKIKELEAEIKKLQKVKK